MKRLYRIFTLLLVLLIITSAITVITFAKTESEELEEIYQNQLKPTGATNYFAYTDASKAFGITKSLGQTIPSTSSDVVTKNGNTYLSMHFVANGTFDSTGGGYRNLIFGGRSTKVTSYGFAYNGEILQKAFVFDIDMMPDRYTLTTEVDGVKTYKTYTPDELKAAGLTPESEGVDISYVNQEKVYLNARYWTGTLTDIDNSGSSSGSASVMLYLVKDTDGQWYYADADTASKATNKVKVSGVGTFDHITMIMYPKAVYDGGTLKGIELNGVAYVNGEIAFKKTILASSKNATSATCDEFRINVMDSIKTHDAYSYAVDNYTANYYGAGYASEGHGIDDLIESKSFTNGALYDCVDVVASKNYVSPNGYIQLKNPSGTRNRVSVPSYVAEELKLIEDGAALYTSMDLENFDIPESVSEIFIECNNKLVTVTPSEKLLAKGYKIEAVEGGYIVKVNDDLVTLKIYDAVGNLIDETTLGFGFAPELDGFDPSSVADGVIKYTESPEWEWSLDGEIRAIDSTMASKGDVITIIPKESSITTISGATFAMGSYDDNYRFIPAKASDGTYTLYKNATGDTLIEEIAAAANGNIAILLADFTGLEGDAANISATKGKDLSSKAYSLDLNGHKLVKIGINTLDQSPLFNVCEGTTLNVYSSRENGEIHIASVRTNNSDFINQLRSGGICSIKSGINTATVNVGALIDEEGNTVYDGDNLTFTGGSLIIYSGASSTADLSNDSKIKINVIGGSYFVVYRGSYAFITLQGPDAEILVDGIQLYGSYSSTSLIHEYTGRSTHGTKAIIRNVEYYGVYLLYRVGVGEYYIENSTVYASSKIVHTSSGGSIVLGAGNKFASKNAAAFFALDNVSCAEGVVILNPQSTNPTLGKIKKDFVHAATSITWDSLDLTLKNDASITDKIDTLEEAAQIESAKFKESVIKNKTTTSISYNCYAVTVSKDNILDGTSVVEWQDNNGTAVAYSYHFAGDSAPVPEKCVSMTTNANWISETLAWSPIESLSSGKTVAKPAVTLEARINGILQNATLFTNMTYNLYLPISDRVTDVSVSGAALGGIVEINESNYYIVSVSPAVYNFEKISATVSYSVDGVAYEYDIYFDIVKYASAVAESYVCGSEEAILVYEILAFKGAVAKYADPSFAPNGDYSAFLEKHSHCNCGKTATDAKSYELNVNYDSLIDKGVSGTAYKLDAAKFDFVILVSNNVKIDSVSYTDSLGNLIVHTEENGKLEKKDGYYSVNDISAAYIDNIMTITAGGSSGTYSLAKYIQNCKNESAKAVATALLSYSRAAEDYKNVTTTEHMFTISFDTDGGDKMPSIKVRGGETIPTIEAPTRFAYKFVEWQFNGVAYDFTTPVTSDITLTAVWERAEDDEIYDGMQSVLLIGQSNMVGVGLLNSVDPIDDDRLFMMRNNGWVKMKEPLHTNTSRAGIGLGASFGKAFADTFGCDVGLIPAAQGSTTLAMWEVGGELYNNAIAMAKAAQETSEIAAILWHQGEGNATTKNYAELLKVILDAMIEELGLDPDKIVIVTGELFGTRSDEVHMGQLIELGQYYKNYGIALSDGLGAQDVTTHFDGPSLRVFGYRYFAIFYNLITGRTYEFDDNPENYWSSQFTTEEYTYVPFDDMLTGRVGTGYSGTSKIEVTEHHGEISAVSGNGGKYLTVSNVIDTPTYINVLNSEGLGSVVAAEMQIRLGENHNLGAYILTMLNENSDVKYENLYLRENGWLAVVKADGSMTDVIQLNETDWVSVRVVLDTERNLKEIYVNDELVLRGVRISNEVDPATLLIDRTALVSYEASASIGCVHIDEYRFHPYFDNLQPEE